MKNIYVHGLGQTASSWDEVISQGERPGDRICLNLADLMQGREVTYNNVYTAFAEACNSYADMVDLCGLSLGGVLSLQYAIDHPQKVNSLILIATQYKMPKKLLRFQNMLFRLMPNSMFEQMGTSKYDFIRLCKTMAELDFSNALSKVRCRTLVICGEKDAANQKASQELADRLVNAELCVMKGVGHEINTEAPKSLARVLQDFYGE